MMNGMSMYGMAGWAGAHWLVMLLVAAVFLVPIWKIFSKAGFSGWLSLLMLVPLVNLIVPLLNSEWVFLVSFKRLFGK